jgi:catechol 2,3-dioxygenase-like lactoylglutathione lyase family enzyme
VRPRRLGHVVFGSHDFATSKRFFMDGLGFRLSDEVQDIGAFMSEYYSDLDRIVDDELWKPQIWQGTKGLYNWGPPPPPSFLAPDDLAGLMVGTHQPGA